MGGAGGWQVACQRHRWCHSAMAVLLCVAQVSAFAPGVVTPGCGKKPGSPGAHRCCQAPARIRWQMGLAPTKEGSVSVGDHTLWYRLVRPMALSSQKGSPLVVLHGGPQVPSDYLFPLSGVEYRTVLFYDQLGCGRSDTPAAGVAEYSVAGSVAALEQVLAGVGVRDFHLLGQSWGGILAYEFLRAGGPAAAKCRSVVLANSPTSVRQVEEEAGVLVEQAGSMEAFQAAHECRLPGGRPPLLLDAYSHAGSTWRGTTAISDWCLDPAAAPLAVPALVLRGEHDFVSDAAVAGWTEAFERCRSKVLAGCSHHALLEDTQEFLEIVDGFTAQYD